MDSIFRDRDAEWLAGAPALGFLFPLYEGGAADVNTLLFFSKDSGDAHPAFLEAAFQLEAVMPAAEQMEHLPVRACPEPGHGMLPGRGSGDA